MVELTSIHGCQSWTMNKFISICFRHPRRTSRFTRGYTCRSPEPHNTLLFDSTTVRFNYIGVLCPFALKFVVRNYKCRNYGFYFLFAITQIMMIYSFHSNSSQFQTQAETNITYYLYKSTIIFWVACQFVNNLFIWFWSKMVQSTNASCMDINSTNEGNLHCFFQITWCGWEKTTSFARLCRITASEKFDASSKRK